MTNGGGAGQNGVSIELRGVRRVFPQSNLVVIGGLDLSIAAGEFLAILGPSGCGKSTLLRMIAGLAAADGGSIQADSTGYQTGFVFQDAHLLPWRSVLDNAALPLELLGVPRDERHARARKELEQVGLGDAVDRFPAQLSGGMRMRVSLARALVTSPKLLLMDEPFAALDEITRFDLEVKLRQLWRERGLTVIFVTHSISEAAFIANRAVVLARRGGVIKVDRRLELPIDRAEDLRTDPRLGHEMKILLESMEEE